MSNILASESNYPLSYAMYRILQHTGPILVPESSVGYLDFLEESLPFFSFESLVHYALSNDVPVPPTLLQVDALLGALGWIME